MRLTEIIPKKKNFKTSGGSKEEWNRGQVVKSEEAEAQVEILWSEVKCSKLKKLYNSTWQRYSGKTATENNTTKHSTVQHSKILHSTTAQHCTDKNNYLTFKPLFQPTTDRKTRDNIFWAQKTWQSQAPNLRTDWQHPLRTRRPKNLSNRHCQNLVT